MRLHLRNLAFLASMLFIASFLGRAYADDGPWTYLEPGISVHFHQVNKQYCTWDFKNTDSSRTLQSMSFTFSYPAPTQGGVYNPYDRKTDGDLIPYPLKPGQVIGGWAAFIAPADCNTVIITVTKREWK